MKKTLSNRKRIGILGAIVVVLSVIALVANLILSFGLKDVGNTSQLEFGYVSNNLALVRGNFGGKSIDNENDIIAQLSKVKQYGFEDAKSELKLIKKDKSAVGDVYRFQQVYNGIEVFGRQLIATVNSSGNISSVSGNYLSGIDIDISKAEQSAKKGELVVYSLETKPTLAYLYYENNNKVFDNAITLERIVSIPLSPGETIPSERVDLELTDHNGNKIVLPTEKIIGKDVYYLADAKRNIYMLDAKNGTFDNGEYVGEIYQSPIGQFTDGNAVTAYNALIKSYDFYANEANTGVSGGLLGIDGSCDNIHDNAESNGEISVNLYMHYGSSYNNAAYLTNIDLTDRTAVLIFGDGDGVNYRNFAQAVDVVAHEYQHAVTNYATQLVYLNASGAISEALSDIFGALIEGKSMESDGFWQCAEDISLMQSAMRNMKNPSLNNLPNGIDSSYFKDFCYDSHNHAMSNCDNGGVHSNSTVISHIIYKLYSADKAFFTTSELSKLWYNAMLKLNPTATFEDMRLALEQTAVELSYNISHKNAISQAFKDADIIATVGSVSVKFYNYDNTVLHTISGRGGDDFVVPESLNGAQEGYLTQWWKDSKYEKRYYINQSYTMPYYDMVLMPINVNKPWNNVELSTISGSGDVSDPYLITSEQDLATLAFYYNSNHPIHSNDDYSRQKYYKQTADIDLLNIPWIPIGKTELDQFVDNYDGNGYAISNFKMTDMNNIPYYGLFGVVTGTVENVNIASGNISVAIAHDIAAIVGLNKGNIIGCSNGANITQPADRKISVGGIVGSNWDGIIEHCSNTGNISGYTVGGIFGDNICTGHKDKNNDILPCPNVMGNNYNAGRIEGVNAGGIAGIAANTYIVNCINIGEIVADSSLSEPKTIGGIVGKLNVPTGAIYYIDLTAEENSGILGCKNTGLIDTSANNYGAIAGIFAAPDTSGNTVSEKNIYKRQANLKAFGDSVSFDGIRIIGDMPKESVDELFNGDFDFDNNEFMNNFDEWSVFAGTSIYDSNMYYELNEGKMPIFKTKELWMYSSANSFSGGDGSAENPYQISCAEELARMAYLVNVEFDKYANSNFILTADIDLKGRKWVSIGGQIYREKVNNEYNNNYYEKSFCGTFNGNGYTIKNMSSSTQVTKLDIPDSESSEVKYYYTTAYPGLFGFIDNGARIENLTMENVNVVSKHTAGAITSNFGRASIVNCRVIGGAVTSDSYAGGIVGISKSIDGLINNVYNNANVSAAKAGGILGECKSYSGLKISNSINMGRITAFCLTKYYEGASAGGVIGRVESDIEVENCINFGEIVGYNSWGNVGGALGLIAQGMNNVFNVSVVGFKSVGSQSAHGQVDYVGDIVGCVNLKYDDTFITLELRKNVINGSQILNSNNIIGIGKEKFTVKSYDNYINTIVGSEQLDFKSIDYYFNDKYWSDIDAEFANDVYEYFGGESIVNHVTFLDYLDNVIAVVPVRYKCSASPPLLAERPNDIKYVYVYEGWDKSIENITESITVRPIYSTTIRKYAITFLNYDESVYQIIQAEYGENLNEYNIKPFKQSDYSIDYEFIGWDKPLELVTGDATYLAQFKEVVRGNDDTPNDNIVPNVEMTMFEMVVIVSIISLLVLSAVGIVYICKKKVKR